MPEKKSPDAAATGASEDTKAKFLEALERKKKGPSKPGDHKHDGPDHAHGEHGAAGGKREFRRKAGG
ncbi:MAG: DUF5302 domain-containing protein [Candidatus Nanopelagicales bacterium]